MAVLLFVSSLYWTRCTECEVCSMEYGVVVLSRGGAALCSELLRVRLEGMLR